MKKLTGLYQNVNQSSFIDSFRACGRGERFTYDGKKALFDYLEQFSEDSGEPIELDVIALCCEYAEFEDFKELQAQYDSIESWADLLDRTQVIPVKGDSFIIQQL